MAGLSSVATDTSPALLGVHLGALGAAVEPYSALLGVELLHLGATQSPRKQCVNTTTVFSSNGSEKNIGRLGRPGEALWPPEVVPGRPWDSWRREESHLEPSSRILLHP